MKKVLVALGLVLVVVASLVLYGSKFATGTVHDQLAAQKISFPDKATLQEDNPALVKYAGQKVDNGDRARAYSEYINGHLKNIAGGKTYSEISSEYQKDQTNQELAAQRTSLFQGETLRGLLLNAWGWGLIGSIAMYAAWAIYAAAAAALVTAATCMPANSKKRSKK